MLPPPKALTEIVETVDVREVELDDDKSLNCFRPFPNRGGVVTNELIDELRNQVGDKVRALLDVNLLIALLDEQHEKHASATHWFNNNVITG